MLLPTGKEIWSIECDKWEICPVNFSSRVQRFSLSSFPKEINDFRLTYVRVSCFDVVLLPMQCSVAAVDTGPSTEEQKLVWFYLIWLMSLLRCCDVLFCSVSLVCDCWLINLMLIGQELDFVSSTVRWLSPNHLPQLDLIFMFFFFLCTLSPSKWAPVCILISVMVIKRSANGCSEI